MLLFSLRLTEVYWVIYLRRKGLSFAAVGLMETVFHMASFSSEVPTGIIADRFGRRISLLTGRLLSAAAAGLMLLTKSWGLLAASFAIQAVSYTCHSGAFDALVYDSLSPDERPDFARIMGRLNSTYLLGTAMAGATAAFLARYSLDWLYRACIVVDILAALVALSLKEDTTFPAKDLLTDAGSPVQASPSTGTPVRASPSTSAPVQTSLIADVQALCRSLKERDLRNLLLLWGVSGALGTSVGFYGQAILKEALPIGMIGIVGTAGHLLAIPPSSSAYRIQRKLGQKASVISGSLLLPVVVAAMGLVQGSSGHSSRAAVVVLYMLVYAVNETLYPLFSDAVNARTGSRNRATVLSSGSMVFSVAMMVMFPLIGYVGDRLGLRWGIAAGACFTALCLIPIAVTLGRGRLSEDAVALSN